VILTVLMQIFKTKQSKKIFLPLYSSRVAAGFPSPADDYIDLKLSLDEYFIKSPHSTFFVTVEGDSMTGDAIVPGDMLIIDRSSEPQDGDIVLAVVDSEFTLKRYQKKNGKMYLVPSNLKYQPIEIKGDMEFVIWGVVTGVVRKLKES
jgi:DNA polymerase V